ncbi:MAG: hypothetical protein HKO59_08855, partial [Phycisphaerales bacterium]|nr:hypothetical protein [Phycisphaerales bacterium]
MTTLTLHAAPAPHPVSVPRITGVVFDTLAGARTHLPHPAAWTDLVPRPVGVVPTAGWCRAWWAGQTHPATLRIIVAYADETLVGVVPVVIETARLGPVRLRVGRLLGCDQCPAGLDPAIRDDATGPVVDHLLDHLVRVERCDAILLRGLRCDSPRARALIARVHDRDDLVRVAAEAEAGLVAELDEPVEAAPEEGVVETLDTPAAILDALPALTRQLDRDAASSSGDTGARLRALVEHVGSEADLQLLQWRVEDRVLTRLLVGGHAGHAVVLAAAGVRTGRRPLLATLTATTTDRLTLGPAPAWRGTPLPIIERR